METNFNRPPNSEQSDAQQEDFQMQGNAPEVPSENSENQEPKKRVKHEDHHVNRKYRLFSNHSSWGDAPHTNTSI